MKRLEVLLLSLDGNASPWQVTSLQQQQQQQQTLLFTPFLTISITFLKELRSIKREKKAKHYHLKVSRG